MDGRWTMGAEGGGNADNGGMAKVRAAAFAGAVSGKVGNAVYIQTADGETIVRDLPRRRDPRTAAQADWRADFQSATALFSGLSSEEHRAWRAYAKDLSRPGQTVRAVNAFIALATTFRRLNPGQWPPRLPPEAPFLGDCLRVTAVGAEGGVTFRADRPNGPDVTTVLMLQRLRSYGDARNPEKARWQRAVRFAEGGLSVTVPARRGVYEAAIRLYKTATGQSTPLTWLGQLEVD